MSRFEFRARRILPLLSCLLLCCPCFAAAQEIDIPLINYGSLGREFNPGELLEMHLQENRNAGSLKPGQWTNVDRMYETERFQEAMLFIAMNNRTELLDNRHELISCYYKYLDQHPTVTAANIRWQKVAAEVVSLIGVFDTTTSAVDGLVGLLGSLSGSSPSEGMSEKGREFLDGTASALVAEDVTQNIYGPLIRGEIPVPRDPFLFDADTLRREQYHPKVLSYYESFTAKDQDYLNHKLNRLYATGGDWKDADLYDLMRARDRLYLGLRKMGYDKDVINAYLNEHGL